LTHRFTTFVDRPLARRLELAQAYRTVHYSEGYAFLHPGASAACQVIDSGVAVFTSSTSPVNKAVAFGLDEPFTHSSLESVEDFYHSRGVRPVFSASPLADPKLFHQLAAGGYSIAGFHSVLWRAIPADFNPAPLPENLRITQADSSLAQLWLDTTARGFEEVDQPSPDAYAILGPNFYAPSSACFFAWVGGQPAAGGGMYIHDGVVELGGASTLPAFRRQGAQRALIEARLAAARDLGCDLALILTEPGSSSQRNAQRMGFELAYTDVILRK
jgi:GNAT superfamily N-acetyltransferase